MLVNGERGTILDGRATAQSVKDSLRPRVEALSLKGIVPCLATVLVGDDPGSKIYVGNKHKACAELGMKSIEINKPASTSQQEVIQAVRELNARPDVHGILVQVPLPPSMDVEAILAEIDPAKDVDGFHPVNLGKLMRGDFKGALIPCTPAGIIRLLKAYHVELKGMEVVIVSRSNIVGKPLVPLFLRENSTVTVCHTGTRDLKFHTRRAGLVVTGVGKAEYFTSDYFTEGVVIVDVGTNRTPGGLLGDVHFGTVSTIASKISPVPGGVGPMTIAMLMENTVAAAERSVA